MLENTNTSSNQRFRQVDQGIRTSIKSVGELIRNLNKTVTKVEKHREKFAHISDQELADRKEFIRDSKQRLRSLKELLNGPSTTSKLDMDRSQAHENDSEPYEAQLLQQEKAKLVDDQDVVLEDMLESISRLGVMGETIMIEIDGQADMLEELDEDIDHAQTRMDAALEKMQRILKTKSRWKLWTILFLSLLFLILFWVVVTK